MKKNRCSLAYNINCILLAAIPLNVLADTGWTINPANNHSYKAVTCGNWQDCEAGARSIGAHLVSIGNAAEQTWLLNKFGGGYWYWIGFTDNQNEGIFNWTTGESITYRNWASGEPNNMWSNGEDYTVMNWSSGGSWNDLGPESPEWDSVNMAIWEIGFDRYIKGSVGNSTSFTVTCLNKTTGKQVSATFTGTKQWDCKSMGLPISAGQGFQVNIQGTLK